MFIHLDSDNKLMTKLLLMFLLIPISSYAQSSIWEDYINDVSNGVTDSSNAIERLKTLESKFFDDVAKLFDELKFTHDEVNYISVKDNASTTLLRWKSHSKDVNIKKILTKIIQDPGYVLNDSELQLVLKDNRKFAHLMRESYYVFDQSHTAPKGLEKFVKPFGKLNDSIVAQNPEHIKNYAQKTLNTMDKFKPKAFIKNFKPVNKKEFLKYFSSVKENVYSLLNKKTSSPHDFHTLRKHYKRFLTVYKNMEIHIPHPKLELLDRYIANLGDLNDIFTDIPYRFGVSMENYQIDFPKMIKNDFIETIHFLETDLTSIELMRSCTSFYLKK